MNVENLKTLALYLLALPATYGNFDMLVYQKKGNRFSYLSQDFVDPDPVTHGCGTVACACGHGPSAGIPALKGEVWSKYAYRAFFDTTPAASTDEEAGYWEWCFSSRWEGVDNTPQGAGIRILYLLTKQRLPGDWDWGYVEKGVFIEAKKDYMVWWEMDGRTRWQ